MIHILAIETSCDETAAAIISDGQLSSNIVNTQEIHKKYGGVVPELASRSHVQNILLVVDNALKKAKVQKKELSAIAFTQGPGLLGALLVGISFAKSMALALNIPLINVHHMKAHILSLWINPPHPKFPFLCLTLSGGHTQMVKLESLDQMEILGQTKDDAIGEAYDKCAKILNLAYPGGALIDKFASKGNPIRFTFPQSQMPNYDFSFSGIKTSLLYFIQREVSNNPNFIKDNLYDICASIQFTLIQMVMKKIKLAVKNTGVKSIGIAGGVSANQGLRNEIKVFGKKENLDIFIPELEYCTDNAAMIAIAGYFKFLKKEFATLSTSPQPRLPF